MQNTASTVYEQPQSVQPDKMLRVGAHELFYQRSGSGPDLVFVHGWPLHSATFRGIVPKLERDYTCHRLDLPCAGRSLSAQGSDTGFRAQISVLRAAIDALELTRYALVAHDSGGMLARYVAADDRRVTGLVLGNTELPRKVPASVAMLEVLAKLPGGAALFRAAMRNRAFRHSSQGFAPCLESRAHLVGEFDALFLEPVFASGPATQRALSVLLGYRELCDGLSDVHARLGAPALLVWGERDSFFPLEGARAMLREFAAGAKLETIAGGRLFAHEEHPDEFVRLAEPFLASRFA